MNTPSQVLLTNTSLDRVIYSGLCIPQMVRSLFKGLLSHWLPAASPESAAAVVARGMPRLQGSVDWLLENSTEYVWIVGIVYIMNCTSAMRQNWKEGS